MEGPAAAVLAVARTDRDRLAAVRWVAVAAAVVLGAASFAVDLAPLVGAPFAIALLVAVGAFSRGNLVEVRVTAEGLDLVGHDGVVRVVPGGAIGGLATTGTVLGGGLVALPLWAVATGRLVVVDHAGRVICSRRAGWLAVDDLEALAAVAGVPWLGSQRRRLPGASLPPPPGMACPDLVPAEQDPATRAAKARLDRRLRRLGLVVFGVLGVAVAAFVVMGRMPAGHDLRGHLGWIGFLGLLGFAFGGPVAGLYGQPTSTVGRLLGTGAPWWPVEAVVVTGLASDPTARVVGVVDPRSGGSTWWRVERGGKQGWLQGDDRTTFWFLPSPDGKAALIAPPDRSHIGVLVQRTFSRDAQVEAARLAHAEEAEWRAVAAWAQAARGGPG